MRRRKPAAPALFIAVALLVAAGCTKDAKPAARATTTSTTAPAPTTTTTIDPRAPKEFTFTRDVEQYLKWTYKAYVKGEGARATYCVQLTLVWGAGTDQRGACAVNWGFDLFQGPVVGDVTTFFGPVARGTARIRLSDAADRVVDSIPDLLGDYNFQGYVAIVPSGFKMEKAVAYDGAGRELRSTTLREPEAP